jgi:CDP-diacylglycerol--serine O-phosphatidyltransferase
MATPRLTAESVARRGLARGVVILPSAFTLGNLFFGFWAIVSALRGELGLAATLVVLAAIADAIDGRVARFTRTGTGFGAELDSLVDVVSFGVAPAVLLYQAVLAPGGEWAWLVCFLYVSAAALRLARFNIEQGGTAKTAFHGLPSPPAGITLASFYSFSQTAFFADHLAGWPWKRIVVVLTVGIAALMVSHVLYPVFPRVRIATWRGRLGALALVLALAAIAWRPRLLLFPAGLGYIAFGVARAAWWGLLDRLPERDPLLDEPEEEASEDETEARDVEYEQMRVRRRAWWRGGRGEP